MGKLFSTFFLNRTRRELNNLCLVSPLRSTFLGKDFFMFSGNQERERSQVAACGATLFVPRLNRITVFIFASPRSHAL